MTGGPIAYLTGEYPRATDTFIQREVAGLRAAGLAVAPCTVRQPDAGVHGVGPEQRAAAAETFPVLATAKKPWRLIAAHLRVLARHPRGWLGAAALSVRMAAPGLRAGLWQAFYFLEAAVLADHLRRIGARHLHVHFGDSSCSLGVLAARMAGVPMSFTLHGPAEFFAAMRWRLDVKIAEARFVACISHFCRSQAMVFAAQEDWPKLRIVHCGVEPARYDRGPRQGPAGQRLLFVGRLAGVKGVPVLLDALARVRARHPRARLTLVGDGPERPAIEAEVARLGLGDAVEITGYLSQDAVAEALAAHDVFVLPSFAEGLPVVLMEALAARLPVVATRIAGVGELVEDGVTGLTVPPGDAAALAAALERLLSDPAAARALGEAGRARVAAAFDSATEARRLAALFLGRDGGALRPGPVEG